MPSLEIFSGTQKLESYDFEMGSLLYYNGNYAKSLPYLKKSLQAFQDLKDFDSYFSCYNLILSALNEMEEKDKIKEWNQKMEKFCKQEGISKSPLILAQSAYYKLRVEHNSEEARENLNKALKMAFDQHDSYLKTENVVGQNQSRFEIIVCLYTYSRYYYEKKDYKNCLQELDNIEILLKDFSDLKEKAEWSYSTKENVQEIQKSHEILSSFKKAFPKVQRLKLMVKCLRVLVEMNHFKNYKQSEKILWGTLRGSQ